MFVTTSVGCTRSLRKERHRFLTKAPFPTAQLSCVGCAPSLLRSNPNRINTYAKRAPNSCRMRTCKIIRLKVPWNEHLRKRGVGESYCYPAANPLRRGGSIIHQSFKTGNGAIGHWSPTTEKKSRQCEKMQSSALGMGVPITGSLYQSSWGGRT